MFLKDYVDQDSNTINDRIVSNKLDKLWDDLYKVEGAIGRPYRNNWDKILKDE
jgi:hypothetical protein